MSTLAERIAQANSRLQTARSNGDAQAEAVAQAEVNQLTSLQAEGWTLQTAANDGASRARNEGETAGGNAERARLATQLGVAPDKLDDEVKRINDERRNQQTEAQRLQGDLSTATSQRDTIQSERDTAVSERDEARTALEEVTANNAIERELLAQGVIHEEEKSHLGDALTLTDRTNVKVTKDDKGNITGVTGAKEAAKSTRERVPALFTGGQLGGVGSTPGGQGQHRGSTNRSSGGQQGQSRTPGSAPSKTKFSVPGQETKRQ